MKEWFKSKPYWLKGGIILGQISLVINGLIFLLCSISGIADDWCFVMFFTTIPLIILARLSLFIWLGIYPSIFLLLTVVTHFVIGAIIGWITGKIKSRK